MQVNHGDSRPDPTTYHICIITVYRTSNGRAKPFLYLFCFNDTLIDQSIHGLIDKLLYD